MAARIETLPPSMKRPILRAVHRIAPQWSFDADGLATIHYRPFTPQFDRLYESMVGWWLNEYSDVRWRMWLLTRFAIAARHRNGDYAEFGTYRGGCAWFILSTVDLTDRRFHLFDTFAGVPSTDLTASERSAQFAGRLADTSVDAVRARLAPWTPIPHLWPGDVSETMPATDTGPLAFAHIDLNAAAPTAHVLTHVYPRLVPGAFVVFDDYAYAGYEEQRVAIERVMTDTPDRVIALPTGQGFFVKSPA